MIWRARKPMLGVLIAVALAAANAFEWTPGQFPEGDQRYTLEFVSGEGEDIQRSTLDIDIVDRGGSYQVTTTMSTEQVLAEGELDLDALGSGVFGLGAFGPALMFGPTFMILPLLLEDQDIRVRSEPVELMGMGTLRMERSERVAGHDCVVIEFEQTNNPDGQVEFALAEDLPFPCFSRYGTGDGTIEIRLVRAE